jgi:ribosome-binding factor A
MREEGRRQRRVASLLLEALGPLILRELEPGAATLVTLTHVDVPADLRSAQVFVSVFGGDSGAVLQRLQDRAGRIRKHLASLVELKYNPELFFSLDPSADMDERIGRLLKSTQSHDRDAD